MALSIDEKKLFVGAEWYCEKNGNGWWNPEKFWNKTNKLHYIQETYSGTYYTFSYPNGDTTRREWCKLVITKTDTTVESLGTPPNVTDPLMDFYIARDESYIIIIMREPSQKTSGGNPSLFISYRKKDNTWTNPKSLGPVINIPDLAEGRWGPYVTRDNKYLFYSYGKDAATTGIRWVRFDGLLDSLRHTNFVPYIKKAIPGQLVKRSTLFQFQVPDGTFMDDDESDSLTYSATMSDGKPLPKWMTFDNRKRTFSGTPPVSGKFAIKITATDNKNESVSDVLTVAILD